MQLHVCIIHPSFIPAAILRLRLCLYTLHGAHGAASVWLSGCLAV
jgi:hypothetical protein